MFESSNRRSLFRAGALAGAAAFPFLTQQARAADPSDFTVPPGGIRFPTPDAPWRLRATTGTDPGGQHDNVVGFSYNRWFDQRTPASGTWNDPDVSTEPSMFFSLESRWNGNAEWNWDLASPGYTRAGRNGPNDFDGRALAASYVYATRDVDFGFGLLMGGGTVGGVHLFGGPNRGGIRVRSAAAGQDIPIFALQRPDGSTFLKVHPTSGHIVLTNDKVSNINSAQWAGAIRIFNAPLGVEFGATSASDDAFRTRISRPGLTGPIEFRLATSGRMVWHEDTALERISEKVLRTDGKLIAQRGLGVGNAASASTLGKLVKKTEVFDAAGNSLGYLPVYDAIS